MTDYETQQPTLYLVMRSDLQDGNPGKMMAQAAHAQADFDEFAAIARTNDHVFAQYHDEWKEDRSFGRTLVLEGTLEQIADIAAASTEAGVTVDPTYPWRNWYGDIFLTEEVTCGWAFVHERSPSHLMEKLKELPLHR